MSLRSGIFLCAAFTALAARPVQASVDIAAAPTKHVTCSAGLCTATAKHAILNIADLETLLTTSDVTVKTGSGAATIEITTPLAWASTRRLTLDADLNVSIKAQVSIQGTGGLTVITLHDGVGGEFLFFPGGKIDFWDTSSSFAVNGNSYTLLNDVGSLAAAVAVSQYGFFALAKDYDAGPDGTYSDSGVPTDLEGTFEGLGHSISNFSVSGTAREIGLFSQVGFLGSPTAALRDIRMANANVRAGKDALAGPLAGATRASVEGASADGVVSAGTGSAVGGLIGYSSGSSSGSINRSFSTASVKAGPFGLAGGLVGWGGAISYSHASGNVTAGRHSDIGGLAGFIDSGNVVQSFATGNVASTRSPAGDKMGGFVGEAGQYVNIVDSYATGSVQAGSGSTLGGMIGYTQSESIQTSYSTGQLTLSGDILRTRVGGFIGKSIARDLENDYWDVDTSGYNNACSKSGYKCTGVTGLTDAAFKANLPVGFDPAIWGQSASLNDGYPYLIANPPP